MKLTEWIKYRGSCGDYSYDTNMNKSARHRCEMKTSNKARFVRPCKQHKCPKLFADKREAI